MRAAIARVGSTVPTIEEVPEPTVGDRDVQIRVRAASVNPADSMVASGPARQLFGLPDAVGLGYDAAGEVEAVGSAVRGFEIGDRVIGMHLDLTAPTRALAELVVLPAHAVARIPDDLEWDAAATVPLNGLTAAQALDLLGEPAGRSLLVTGAAGAVGGHAIAAAADASRPCARSTSSRTRSRNCAPAACAAASCCAPDPGRS